MVEFAFGFVSQCRCEEEELPLAELWLSWRALGVNCSLAQQLPPYLFLCRPSSVPVKPNKDKDCCMHYYAYFNLNCWEFFFLYFFNQLTKEPNIFEVHSGLFLLAFLQIKGKKCVSQM